MLAPRIDSRGNWMAFKSNWKQQILKETPPTSKARFGRGMRLPNDLGNFPPSSLNDKSILMADVRFPMALEIVPRKLLELRRRNSRRLKLYNQLGIEELKLLPDRSRCLREVVFWRSTGIGP
ncbi:hypothetical protein CFP56_003332 [Quercus suber]|uniref:Uncharacterized protein n=1 Tax=Quercus suber TaxID=58331 RepID=A0AAW0IJ33_QUESU